MNWFETDGSAKGAYADGTAWAAGDLQVTHNGGSLTVSPNTSTYANSINSADPNAIAYWTNSQDGGVTSVPDGNKWIEASYFLEAAGDNLA
jgi:hypothetical protein